MASKTGGIALLSMYNDEEDEDFEEEQQQYQQQQEQQLQQQKSTEEIKQASIEQELNGFVNESEAPDLNSMLPPAKSPELEQKTLASPVPPTPPLATTTMVLESVNVQRVRRGSLAIVDYGHDDGHDDSNMSPDHEEVGMMSSSCQVVITTELQVPDGITHDGTPREVARVLTPSTQQIQPSELLEQSKSETTIAMDFIQTEPEVIADVEMANADSEEMQNSVDPLINFLPPPVTIKCSDELQEKINKFLAYKRAGKSFNAEVRNRKDYRNPDFLQHAVRYQDIDQIGTCFSKDVFDPHGYDKSDYYDEIEADMKREMERKEQERKRNQKVEFVPGTQPVTGAPALKINSHMQAASALTTGAASSVPANPNADARESRRAKKTKWDKVDADVKNPVQFGGHDNVSNVGIHAAHLSAANAGTGYSAFVQQKRREAEERKMSERKFEKRPGTN